MVIIYDGDTAMKIKVANIFYANDNDPRWDDGAKLILWGRK